MQPDYIGERTDYRTIRIRISDWCNFNCTYCIEHDTLPKDKFIGQFDLLGILENLKRINQLDEREQRLFLWGGEPLLNKNLLWFLERVRTYYPFITEIELHTNLSIRLEDDFFDSLNEYDVKVSSSIHLEYDNKFNVCLENMIKADARGLLHEVNLMLSRLEDFDRCKEIKRAHSNLPISIVPTFQLQDSNLKKIEVLLTVSNDWKDKPIKCSDKNRNYIEVRNNINVKDMMCSVPAASFIINTDGSVYLCQNDFISGNKTKYNFFLVVPKEDLEFFMNASICQYQKCDCEHTVLKRSIKIN